MNSVTPWEVKGEIDYERLVKEFGVERLNQEVLNKLKKYTKDLHFLLRRNIFFAHRDLNFILNEYEKGNKFFLYTGRGPSGNVHIGHLMPWMMTKWLQDKFNVELYFQLTDDEKFLFKENLSLEDTNRLAYENALDVIALGFNPKKTFIFVDTDYGKTMYKQAIRVAKKITFSTNKAVFGFQNENNIGEIFYPAMQIVPCFLPSVLKKKNIPCLIPMAIDQDPFFRVGRDVLPKLGYLKPGALHCMFMPGLQGTTGKMSTSDENSAIYTTDTPEIVEKKIKKYAFSGGQATLEEHRKLGGNPDVDVSYQWLRMMFEPDDKKLKKIHDDYKSGKLLTGELKEILIKKVNLFLKEHQKNREKARKNLDKFILKD